MDSLASFECWDEKNKVKGVTVSKRLALKPYVTLADKLTDDVLYDLPNFDRNAMIREMAETLDWFEQNWGSPVARNKKSLIYRMSKGIDENPPKQEGGE